MTMTAVLQERYRYGLSTAILLLLCLGKHSLVLSLYVQYKAVDQSVHAAVQVPFRFERC